MMKDTVAIVGSHPKTSKNFDFDREDCDIWVFNEALKTDWCKRADGVFQIHQPVIWRSKTNRNDPDHYEWLKSGDTPTIYMIDQYEDVPRSERYPLDEIMDKYWIAEKYFTSSVAYSLALAVYKGYKKIEVYGVEMETGTEYGHQRVGVAYWIGFAQGQGVEVDFHGNILTAPLYGYDGDVRISIDFFEGRIDAAQPHATASHEQNVKVHGMIKERTNAFIETYKADLSELDNYVLAFGQNSHNNGLWNGIVLLNENYLKKCKQMLEESGIYLIVRQEYEAAMHAAGKNMQKATMNLQRVGVELKRARDKLNTNARKETREQLVKEFMVLLGVYQKASYEFGKTTAFIKESQFILQTHDQLLRSSGIYVGDGNFVEEVEEEERIEVLS
jgi:hypothetical protein